MDVDDIKTLRFFVSVYDELTELTTDAELTDYKVNHLSRLLRQLLFDRHSIVAATAHLLHPGRKRRGRVIFKCCPYIPKMDVHLEFGGAYDGFQPQHDAPFKQTIRRVGSILIKRILI